MNKNFNFKTFCIFLLVLRVSNGDQSNVDKLIEIGEIVKIRGYYESPDSDVFVNLDPVIERPAKIIDHADHLKSLFGDWDIKNITHHMVTSVIYGNLTQMIKEDQVDGETNLYRFLSQIDDYVSPTIVKFDLPLFMREELILPSILECDYTKHQLNDAHLNFYLNFETYSPFESVGLEQLICILKGNLSMVLMKKEEHEKFVSYELNPKEEDLKQIKYSIGELSKGQCFFIPQNLTYSVKTDNSWFYSISWPHIDQRLGESDCFKYTQRNASSKLSSLAFRKDLKGTNKETKIGFVSYFLLYLDPLQTNGIGKNEFIEKVKTDQTIMKTIQNCENQCPYILNKMFRELDIDGNAFFSLNDISNLDYDGLLKLNSKLEKHIQDLGQSVFSQIETLKKSFKQLRDLADQHGMRDKVFDMLKEKLGDWKNTLSEEDKKKYGDIEMDKLFGKLFGLEDLVDEKNERTERKEEAKRKLEEKQKKKDREENAEQSFVNLEETEEAEIMAEDEDELINKEEL